MTRPIANSTYDNGLCIEEPDDVKVSCPVLEAGWVMHHVTPILQQCGLPILRILCAVRGYPFDEDFDNKKELSFSSNSLMVKWAAFRWLGRIEPVASLLHPVLGSR